MRAVAALVFVFVAACVGGGDDPVDPVPWHKLSKPPGSSAIGAVYVNGDRVYLYGNDFNTYETSDNGESWTSHPFSYVVSSNDGRTMFALGSNIPQRSSDGGATWEDHPTALGVVAIAVDHNRLYGFETHYDPTQDADVSTPYRSDDGGSTTVPLPPDDLYYAIGFLPDAVDNELVYADTPQGEIPAYMRSDDHGATWTNLSFDLGKIRVDPSAAGALWRFTATSVAHSDDAGDNFTDLPGVTGTVQDLVAEPDGTALLLTADHSIWQVTAAGDYTEVGATTVDVGQAFRGGTAESLVIVPPTYPPDAVYVTHTLGN